MQARKLGDVLAAETGFTLLRTPDTVRAPDVSQVRRDRGLVPAPRGDPALAPDLAVEVLSLDDRPGEALARVGDWSSAGCGLVWVVDPVRRTARVHRADGTESHLTDGDTLEGAEVLPEYSRPLASVL